IDQPRGGRRATVGSVAPHPRRACVTGTARPPVLEERRAGALLCRTGGGARLWPRQGAGAPRPLLGFSLFIRRARDPTGRAGAQARSGAATRLPSARAGSDIARGVRLGDLRSGEATLPGCRPMGGESCPV